MKTTQGSITVGERGSISTECIVPTDADAFFVFAHGAGAPMRHPFMVQVADALAQRGIASLRFNFLYAEAGRKRPDHRKVLLETLDAVLAHAAATCGELPLFAGGKSMGGRMSSHAELDRHGVRGLLFFGYPLHAPGKPGTERAANLGETSVPMLFLQGTRDKLAEIELITAVTRELGEHARLRIIDGADHSFHVLKRSGRTDEEVIEELADAAASFVREVGRLS